MEHSLKSSTQPSNTGGHGGDFLVTVAGEEILLLPERAMFWPRRKTLFVADLHWGHATALRRSGIPIPMGSTADDLGRLNQVLQRLQARRVVALGDLLHCHRSRQPELLQQIDQWREATRHVEFVLVRGNHDRRAGDPPASWEMTIVEEPTVESPFVWRHLPAASTNGYVLAGHVHPLARLRGGGQQQVRLPCFHFTANCATLPAFSGLARGVDIGPQPQDSIYVIADREVIPV